MKMANGLKAGKTVSLAGRSDRENQAPPKTMSAVSQSATHGKRTWSVLKEEVERITKAFAGSRKEMVLFYTLHAF